MRIIAGWFVPFTGNSGRSHRQLECGNGLNNIGGTLDCLILFRRAHGGDGAAHRFEFLLALLIVIYNVNRLITTHAVSSLLYGHSQHSKRWPPCALKAIERRRCLCLCAEVQDSQRQLKYSCRFCVSSLNKNHVYVRTWSRWISGVWYERTNVETLLRFIGVWEPDNVVDIVEVFVCDRGKLGRSYSSWKLKELGRQVAGPNVFSPIYL